MLNFSSVRNMIRQPQGRTAVEIRAAIADVELALKEYETRAGRLEERRKGVLLTGTDAEIEEIDALIKSGNLEVERHHAAIGELNRLLEEVATVEQAATIEARTAAGRALQSTLINKFVELDSAASLVAELLAAIQAGQSEITTINQFLVVDSKRPDLAIVQPLTFLAQHVSQAGTHSLQMDSWHLPGYWPRALAVPSRYLRHMANLLPAPQRKAA